MVEPITPVAPAAEAPAQSPAPQPSETNQPTTNPAPEAPAPAPEITAEQVAQFFKTDAETINKMQKFYGANGGAEKAFAKVRQDVAQQPSQQQVSTNAAEVQQLAQQPMQANQAPVKTPAGMMSRDEFLAMQYFQMLSNNKEYANISNELKDGTAVKEMMSFGINPMVDGNINDEKVRQFLDLYVKTKPATPPTTPESGAPTADFYQTPDGKITTDEQARAIYAQPNHPQRQEAIEFMRQKFMGKPAEKK